MYILLKNSVTVKIKEIYFVTVVNIEFGGYKPCSASSTPMSHDMLLYGRFLTFFCLLWPPYEIGQAIIFLPCGFYLLLLFSSPNLSGLRLDVYHTSTHCVALVRI